MSEYTIRRQNSCYLVIGSIPVSEFVVLMKTWENMDDEMIVDSLLAHRLGVNFVVGSRTACFAWRDQLGITVENQQNDKETT